MFFNKTAAKPPGAVDITFAGGDVYWNSKVLKTKRDYVDGGSEVSKAFRENDKEGVYYHANKIHFSNGESVSAPASLIRILEDPAVKKRRDKKADFDPHDIGEQKAPEVNETAPYLRDTDQRWFSEVENLYPTPAEVWDGEGYMPEQRIRKLASRYLTEQAINRVAARFLRGAASG